MLLSPTILFTLTYSKSVFAGIENPIGTSLNIFSNPLSFIPPATFHMWFLYYLFLISVLSFFLGFLFESLSSFTQWTTKIFIAILKKPVLKFLVFTVITIVLLFIMNATWVATSTGWIPDLKTFLFYFFFYGFGWILFKSKRYLETFLQFDWIFTISALVLISVQFVLMSNLGFELKILLNAACVWLFIFGITGLFIRYGSKHSHLMRYNSDSSYWIYLIHLSIVAFLPGLIAEWQVGPIVKFLTVFTFASVICVFTYHYFVRSTFIGKFLNGRKYSRNIHAKLKPAENRVR